VGAESETNYSNLNIDTRAKSDSGLLCLDNEPADSDGFSLGTTRVSSSLTTDYLDDGNTSNYSVVNNS
jgi:hypothetical protein